MFEIGRLCVKIAGRDAKQKAVIIDVLDNNYVLIDGAVRRKKCNVKHLLPLKEKIDLKKGASHDVVVAEFRKLNLEVKETKPKEKEEKPRKIRGIEKKEKQSRPAKKAAKPKQEPKIKVKDALTEKVEEELKKEAPKKEKKK